MTLHFAVPSRAGRLLPRLPARTADSCALVIQPCSRSSASLAAFPVGRIPRPASPTAPSVSAVARWGHVKSSIGFDSCCRADNPARRSRSSGVTNVDPWAPIRSARVLHRATRPWSGEVSISCGTAQACRIAWIAARSHRGRLTRSRHDCAAIVTVLRPRAPKADARAAVSGAGGGPKGLPPRLGFCIETVR